MFLNASQIFTKLFLIYFSLGQNQGVQVKKLNSNSPFLFSLRCFMLHSAIIAAKIKAVIKFCYHIIADDISYSTGFVRQIGTAFKCSVT